MGDTVLDRQLTIIFPHVRRVVNAKRSRDQQRNMKIKTCGAYKNLTLAKLLRFNILSHPLGRKAQTLSKIEIVIVTNSSIFYFINQHYKHIINLFSD